MIKTNYKKLSFILIVGILAAPLANAASIGLSPVFIGPSSYKQFSDSPFFGGNYDYFYLEDFEDGNLNTPGVITNAGYVVSNSTTVDSVDGDDKNPTNGSCSGCSSYFGLLNGVNPPIIDGLVFSFDESSLGSLPTSVGLVWTDGLNNILFEAFDSNGISLGGLTGTHVDGDHNGATDEDRFYGVQYLGGISKISISSDLTIQNGIEIDHLQYGLDADLAPVPLPDTISMFILGLITLSLFKSSRKKFSIAL